MNANCSTTAETRSAEWTRFAMGTTTLLYQFLLLAGSLCPLGLAYPVARRIGRLRYRRRRSHVRLQPELRLALNATPEEFERWLKISFELSACEDLECYLYRKMTSSTVDRLIRFDGLEHLQQALDRGKGAILYSGHVRGHHTFYAALGALGYKPHVVGHPRRFGFTGLERWFQNRRDAVLVEKLGCQYLMMQPDNFGVAVKAANALRRNQVVIMYIDKTSSKYTSDVRFLGGGAPFPIGPVLLAQSTGAPLLDFFVYRAEQWFPQIGEIGAPYCPARGTEEGVQHCASCLERQVLRHPAQWYHFWLPNWQLSNVKERSQPASR